MIEPQPNPAQDSFPEQDKDVRMWAMFCHLAGLAGFLPIIPLLGSVLGPLIVWLVKKEQSPFIEEQGKEALNFQITMCIYLAISAVFMLLPCLGILVILLVALTDIILSVIAAVRANDGHHYRYPSYLSIKFIR